MRERFPLGYITIEGGKRPIYAFDDFFLNYTFNKKENWEELRAIINILLGEYELECPNTVLKPIKDEIVVTTQFKNHLKNHHKPKAQDFVIKEIHQKKLTYIEMQNKASTAKPIELRAIEYFVLGISQNPGLVSNQIWLLAENVDRLLHGKTFANYLLKEETSGVTYPNASSILFVNMQKLSDRSSIAGEVAAFLLGKTRSINSGKAKRISSALKKSSREFSKDKGVKKSMSIKQKWQDEAKTEGIEEGIQQGKQQGIQQGIQQGAAKIVELIKAGLSPEEALENVCSK